MPVAIRTKKDVVTEFRCAEILRAARSVFATKGYHGATVDDIAELADVAKGTIYCYFPSKLDVFVATLRQDVLELQALTTRNIAAAPTAAEKIRAFIRTRLEYCDRNREFFRIYFNEFSSLALQPTPLRQEFQDVYHEQAHLLESVIAEGIGAGELRALNARRAAYMIYEVARAAIVHRIQGWDSGPVEESEETIFDLLWRGVACK